MKKIIKGKRYDTDTAKLLAEYSYSYPGDFNHIEEQLYIKTTGEYFLYGEGGANSRYAEWVTATGRTSGWKIIPLTPDEAREWGEEHLAGDKYEEIFGEVIEDDTKQTVTFSLTLSTIEKIKRMAGETECSKSEVIEQLVNGRAQGILYR